MKRSSLLVGIAAALVLLASLFAPAPVSQTVQADEKNACKGLRRAYSACLTHNPDGSQCSHIQEQLVAHGCQESSSGGS
jgi:hypothetical protein